ncbi:MAG: hypothetical protein JXB07_18500 [Anaerolineae bacterium]|nr:hypothetical protein [Anaerolineae bacterium]
MSISHTVAKPAIVFPLNDPEGVMFPNLVDVLPVFKQIFARAYVSIAHGTGKSYPDRLRTMAADDFFMLFQSPPDCMVGDYFRDLYRQTALIAPPTQVLHLCFIDRVVFALQSRHKRQFIEDVKAVDGNTPVIFSRSSPAWDSHPVNYRDIELFVTRVGELMLGKTLDFAWCHLAIQAARLSRIIDQTHNHDLSMVTEIVLAISETATMQAVDWLEWEDPFHMHRDAQDLKREREASIEETEKRLAYAIPMIRTVIRSSQK